ncbi:MAG: hypothetical protein WA151_20360, partial [Desulfatirhabdiaceae bacterium]
SGMNRSTIFAGCQHLFPRHVKQITNPLNDRLQITIFSPKRLFPVQSFRCMSQYRLNKIAVSQNPFVPLGKGVLPAKLFDRRPSPDASNRPAANQIGSLTQNNSFLDKLPVAISGFRNPLAESDQDSARILPFILFLKLFRFKVAKPQRHKGKPIYCFGEPVDQQSGDRAGRLQPTTDGQYNTLCLCLYVPLFLNSYLLLSHQNTMSGIGVCVKLIHIRKQCLRAGD